MNILAGFRNSFSRSSDAIVAPVVDEPSKASAPAEAPIPEHDHLDSERRPTETEHTPREVAVTQLPVAAEHAAPGDTATTVSEHAGIEPKSEITSPKPTPRRWSFQHLVRGKRSATTLDKSGQETPGVNIPHKSSAAERRAQHNAQVVRALIVGPDSTSPNPGKRTRTVSKQEVIKTKAALLEPREANKVIAHLRTLPLPDAPAPSAPIHAVCFPFKEAEADEGHFSRMKKGVGVENDSKVDKSEISAASAPPSPPSISSATFESLADTFKNLQLVSLTASLDFGLGQPGNGNGILAGALPTAETIIKGAVQVTPQLMSLGYATGRAIVPNHTGVYPPTDRMSVLTYWWGLELVLPEPTMSYLDQAQSISHTMMNFLSGLALVYGGVREILPFIRYISQFMEWEFGAIKAQDQGQGVVCAATWIMPAAMVPRAWDFPTPPATAPLPATPEVDAPDSTAPTAPSEPSEPEPARGAPAGAPTIPSGQTPDTAPERRQPDALPSAQAPPPTISPIDLFPGGMTTQAVGAAPAT